MKRKLVLSAAVIAISVLHYFSPITYPNLHSVYQRLYYVPVVLGAYWFGLRGGLIFALLSGIAYVPHILFQWSLHPTEAFTQYVEIVMFTVVGSLVGVLSDIQRLQSEQLKKAHEKIRRMDRLSLLGQLAAGLAHEIRNPLGSLIGSAEILEEAIGPEHPKREFLDIMKAELNRSRDKLNEFLKFARPARPQILPNDINDVVRATLALAKQQAEKLGCRIVTELSNSMPMVPMDSEQLKAAVLNLLLNGCQAMPDGGSLTIRTWDEDNCACLSVWDEGPGISPDKVDKVFEPFYTTKEKGTGLGLATVKQLVEGQNGTVSLFPAGKGACFEIRIPHV